MADSDHRRDTVLPSDHGTMRHHSPDLHHQFAGGQEERGPPRISGRQTRISPGSSRACADQAPTRTRPPTTPADTGLPTSTSSPPPSGPVRGLEVAGAVAEHDPRNTTTAQLTGVYRTPFGDEGRPVAFLALAERL